MAQREHSSGQGNLILDNNLYNVITIMHEKSKGLEAYDKYLRDAQSDANWSAYWSASVNKISRLFSSSSSIYTVCYPRPRPAAWKEAGKISLLDGINLTRKWRGSLATARLCQGPDWSFRLSREAALECAAHGVSRG
jgi:hypothetical protein